MQEAHEITPRLYAQSRKVKGGGVRDFPTTHIIAVMRTWSNMKLVSELLTTEKKRIE